jgi:putative membrane protein
MMYERGFGALSNCFRGAGFMRGGIGGLLMILVVAAVVIGLIYFTKKSGKGKTDNEALRMLKLKYAQGEITEEEYLKRKNILE